MLEASGPPARGVLGIPVTRIGEIDGFAFPFFENVSKKPVTVTGFHVVNVPPGARIEGYAVYDINDTGGFIMSHRYKPLDHGTPDLAKEPDYLGKPFVIGAGRTPDRYVVVKVEVTGKITRHLTDCQVDYTQDGKSYSQILRCEYALDSGSA